LIDIEFAAQHLQIVHAAAGGPLRANTGEALAAIQSAGLLPQAPGAALHEAWVLQQNLSQLLKVALAEDADPTGEPAAFKALLAQAGDAADFDALRTRLRSLRAEAHKAFEAQVADLSSPRAARATEKSPTGVQRPDGRE
jgi:glutamate-ammonia-ligase adenylyltransferase